MKKLTVFAIGLAALLIGAVAAYIASQMHIPMEGNIPAPTMEVRINNTLMANDELFNWGDLNLGLNTAELNITNTNDYKVNATLLYTDLPIGWTLTWTANKTILDPAASAIANMELTVPNDATAGTHSWNTYAKVEAWP